MTNNDNICDICLHTKSALGVIYHDEGCPNRAEFPDLVS